MKNCFLRNYAWISGFRRVFSGKRAFSGQLAIKSVVLCTVLFSKIDAGLASDPVPAARLPYGGTWEGKVGVIGGIPNRTVEFTTLSPGATLAQINSAIANCPSNQVVHLTAGTYSFGGTINLNKSGVTLRGDVDAKGAPTTIIKGSTISLGKPGWDFGSSSSWTTTTVSSGATRGSTQMTLASVSGLTPGRLVWVYGSRSAEVTGGNWSDVFGSFPVSQVMKVVAVSGTTVTFEQAFNADYWSGTVLAGWKNASD